jgi:hypothetical protein
MHAAIRQYQVAGSVDEVMRELNEGFLPHIKDASGFQAYYALDAGMGRIATVSVFEDEAGAEESTRMAADYVRQNMASLLPNPPEVLQGEVGAHEAASGGPLSAVTDTAGGVTEPVGGVTDTAGGVTEPVGGVTDTVGGITKPVSGVTDTVGGATEPVRGVTDKLLGGGEEKKR